MSDTIEAALAASKNRRSLKTGNKRAPLSERGLDSYETPAVATIALLKVERLPRVIWEPACGSGKIVKVLRAAGHRVYGSDICDYGCPEADHSIDFLSATEMPYGVEAIVSNPPFKLPEDFIAHALDSGVAKVVMLLRLAFLEGVGRSPILDNGKLARVYVFRNRLPMMHRTGWKGRRASSAMAFAWFVWEIAHNGHTEMRRISWEAAL
jgi:hypothetical protein